MSRTPFPYGSMRTTPFSICLTTTQACDANTASIIVATPWAATALSSRKDNQILWRVMSSVDPVAELIYSNLSDVSRELATPDAISANVESENCPSLQAASDRSTQQSCRNFAIFTVEVCKIGLTWKSTGVFLNETGLIRPSRMIRTTGSGSLAGQEMLIRCRKKLLLRVKAQDSVRCDAEERVELESAPELSCPLSLQDVATTISVVF